MIYNSRQKILIIPFYTYFDAYLFTARIFRFFKYLFFLYYGVHKVITVNRIRGRESALQIIRDVSLTFQKNLIIKKILKYCPIYGHLNSQQYFINKYLIFYIIIFKFPIIYFNQVCVLKII